MLPGLISPLYKLPLIAWSSVCVHVSFTSPTLPPTTEERAKYAVKGADVYTPCRGKGVEVKKLMSHMINVVDALSIMVHYWSRMQAADNTLSDTVPTTHSSRVTTAYLVGIVLMTLAAAARVMCYREMGPSFTFNLSVKSDQKLVTTGPYAIVRHPGYTALMVHLLADIIMQLTPGSWFMELGCWKSGVGLVGAAVWMYLVWLPVAFFFRRAAQEDRTLHEEFGKQWEIWARGTPDKFIPWIY